MLHLCQSQNEQVGIFLHLGSIIMEEDSLDSEETVQQ